MHAEGMLTSSSSTAQNAVDCIDARSDCILRLFCAFPVRVLLLQYNGCITLHFAGCWHGELFLTLLHSQQQLLIALQLQHVQPQQVALLCH